MYETLFGYTSDSTELSGFLATEVDISTNGLVYSFTLRDGVTFHSGNEFTCKDVEWSLEYGLVTAQPSGAVNYLAGNALLGTSLDGSDKTAYMAAVNFADIDAAIECPDGPNGLQLEITLQQPEPALLALLSYTSFSVIDSSYAIDNGMWDGTEATWADWIGRDLTSEHLHGATSGTGAYQISEIAAGFEKITLQGFEDHWAGAPDIDTVVVEVEPILATRVEALKSGDADRADNVESALSELESSPGVSVLSDPAWSSTSVTAAFLNFDIDPSSAFIGSGDFAGGGIPTDFFADVDIRRAFSHLYDPEGFIADSGLSGTVLTMALPPSFDGYDSTADVRTLDLAAAETYLRTALTEEQWNAGFEFSAVTNEGNPTRLAMLEEIAANLAVVNPLMIMNVEERPFSELLSLMYSGALPISVSGWAADHSDASGFINPFYDAAGYYSAVTSIDVPQIQSVVDAAKATVDANDRAALYEQLGDLHYTYAPMILSPSFAPIMIIREGVTGIYLNSFLAGDFLWKDVSKD